MIRILQNIFELIYFERARRDLSIGGGNLCKEPKLDFIWIFEISAVLKMYVPVRARQKPVSHYRLQSNAIFCKRCIFGSRAVEL